MKEIVLMAWVALNPAHPLVVDIDGYETLQQCYSSGQILDGVWASMGVEHHHVCVEK